MRVMVTHQGDEELGSRREADRERCSRRWASSTNSSSRRASCWPATACARAEQASAAHLMGDEKFIVDGPFTESKELIAGYWVWQVKSMDEALEWVRRCPHPMPGEDADIEIRPLYEAEDFEELFR